MEMRVIEKQQLGFVWVAAVFYSYSLSSRVPAFRDRDFLMRDIHLGVCRFRFRTRVAMVDAFYDTAIGLCLRPLHCLTLASACAILFPREFHLLVYCPSLIFGLCSHLCYPFFCLLAHFLCVVSRIWFIARHSFSVLCFPPTFMTAGIYDTYSAHSQLKGKRNVHFFIHLSFNNCLRTRKVRFFKVTKK